MIERVKNKAGFTLAELMMSVAIILILAAIAIPSIITAQNNMRMVELNNAAQSIANAAQTQMTAMKVSGTWLAFLDERSEGSGDYLLRDEARSSKIITPLSIDSTVYDGDYVIVFDRATASVTEVYYADGKSGFFGDAPASTNAAQDYYVGGGSSAQTARMQNDPMIGYYAGTPAGATPEAALKNPVIWVDEEGKLCVQDPNIAEDASSGSTNTTVSVRNTTQNVSFVLSSLSKVLRVETEDGSDSLELSGPAAEAVVRQVDRGGKGKGNVFSIDLNALLSGVLAKSDGILKSDVFEKCTIGDDLTVRAEVVHSNKPYVPSSATANITWPEPVGKFTLMVTNPYSEVVNTVGEAAHASIPEEGDVAEPASSLYKEPSVYADPSIGKVVASVSEDTDHYLRKTKANEKLVAENKQAGYQSYKGASVATSSVQDDGTFRFKATVGSYNNHAYQVWELWLKRADNGEMMRVGYLNEGAWEWAKFNQEGVSYDYAALNDCFTWYDESGNACDVVGGDTDALGVATLSCNASAYLAAAQANPQLQLADKDGNVALYVRTAPKISEVKAFFAGLAHADSEKPTDPDLATLFSDDGIEQISSRDTSDSSAVVRAAFESEFGASSSDVAWTVSNQRETGFDQGNAYFADLSYQNVRAYYSIAPALGFDNIRTFNGGNNDQYLSGVRSTRMTDVALWLFRGSSLDDLQAMPDALLKNEEGFEYACRQGANYDFKLTTLEDYRFYRVLSYYDEDGETKLDYPDQYVPHREVQDAIIPGEGNLPTKQETDEYTYPFLGWATSDVRDTDKAASILCMPGDSIEKHDDQLALSGAKFTAQFDEIAKPKVSLGLAYLELDESDAVTGWYGYLGTTEDSFDEKLLTDNDIDDWGYFILAAEGTERSAITQPKASQYTIANQPIAINLLGTNLLAYRILATSDAAMKNKATPIEVYMKQSTPAELHATYQVNFNFAHAVAFDVQETENWGEPSSPWAVRHAIQFPGSLKWYSNDSVQKAYMSKAFVQEHDLDMADVEDIATHSYKFNNVFSGVYDGGNYRILNFGRATYSAAGDTNGFSLASGAPNQGQGLFPCIEGDSSKDDVLMNVRLVVGGDSFAAIGTNAKANFGFLVGNAALSRISNCTLEGNAEAADAVAMNGLSSNTLTVSPLIGYAEQCEIEGCKVSDIEIGCSWRSGGNVGGLTAGLIVAQASQVVISECSAKKVTLRVNGKINPSASVRLGGIVGCDERSLNESSCEVEDVSFSEVEDVSFSFADNQNNLDKLSVGSVVGAASTACLVSRNTVTQPVRYTLGKDVWIPVESEIGASK